MEGGGSKHSGPCLSPTQGGPGALFLQGLLKIASGGKGLVLSCSLGKGKGGERQRLVGDVGRERVAPASL